jgi:hypothetical protein
LFIERPKELFMPCIIKPLDDKEGLITAIRYDACKCMIQVRYFDFAGIRHDWFYDFELELKNLREKDKAFFRSY